MESTATVARKGHAGTTVPIGTRVLRRIRETVRTPAPLFKVLHRNEEKFECPICSYEGPFASFSPFVASRKYARCPQCDGLERHRLEYLAVKDALGIRSRREMKMLHIAPEPFFKQMFSRQFAKYETADLFMKGVDHNVDICDMPFDDRTYDFILASHVLEHILDDRRAIKEIRRVLRPNGVAVLPVPIVSDKTIEYHEANPFEEGHVRAPGPDYFERFREHFGRVEVYGSNSFPSKHQIFVHEDRSKWPSPECPLRPAMQGTKHPEFVPVCYV
jgi:SAM-dependent methyltransferase